MKKITFLPLAVLALATIACDDDVKTTWDEYADWRNANEQWLNEQAQRKNPDGTPYFQKVVPDWNPGAYVLIHYFNDRAETEGNLSPLYTSTIDTRYELHLYNGLPVDSSTTSTSPAPASSALSSTTPFRAGPWRSPTCVAATLPRSCCPMA